MQNHDISSKIFFLVCFLITAVPFETRAQDATPGPPPAITQEDLNKKMDYLRERQKNRAVAKSFFAIVPHCVVAAGTLIGLAAVSISTEYHLEGSTDERIAEAELNSMHRVLQVSHASFNMVAVFSASAIVTASYRKSLYWCTNYFAVLLGGILGSGLSSLMTWGLYEGGHTGTMFWLGTLGLTFLPPLGEMLGGFIAAQPNTPSRVAPKSAKRDSARIKLYPVSFAVFHIPDSGASAKGFAIGGSF